MNPLLLLILLIAQSCTPPTDECTTGEYRCDGPTVLYCDNYHNWQPEYCWDDQNKTCCKVDKYAYCAKICRE